jgi:N-formylglutamate amidohydrolase
MRFYRKDLRVSAVMIEVRRGLYMDEGSGARLPGFDEIRERISTALRTITAVRTSRPGGP